MRRIYSILFALPIALMSIVLVSTSCSSENDPINPDDTVQTDDSSQTDDTDQTDDTSQTDDTAQSGDDTGADDGSGSAVEIAGNKTLVVYYSYTGNSETNASELVKLIDADLLEVEPQEEGLQYDADGYKLGSELISAIRSNPDDADSYPAIKPLTVDWSDYSTVIIVAPLWWSNMSAPMQTFLFQNGTQIGERTVGLIISSSSSGISGVVDDAERLLPNANWLSTSLHITSSQTSNAASLISDWLEEVGLANENNTEFMNQIEVKVNGYTLTATLVDNSSTRALVDLLKDGDITIEAHDYGNFEKVGSLPESLPRNDEEITTSAGDIILYLGTSICFYYSTNTWDFTRLGRIDNAESYDLKEIYGSGDATFVLSLP